MITANDIGRRVQDDRGRVGILRDLIPDYEDPSEYPPAARRQRATAFVWPEGGGREWLTTPESVDLL
ncbi:hypothetical protein DEJ44_32140 [Streptomyces venezuelae]|nr:hypothetical protein DEJ44_32140 [Streptomyces venezuelae]